MVYLHRLDKLPQSGCCGCRSMVRPAQLGQGGGAKGLYVEDGRTPSQQRVLPAVAIAMPPPHTGELLLPDPICAAEAVEHMPFRELFTARAPGAVKGLGSGGSAPLMDRAWCCAHQMLEQVSASSH